MKLSAEGITDKGLSRKNNEDNLCLDPGTGLFAVADGVGGSASGEVASRIAMEVLRDHIHKTAPRENSLDGPDRTGELTRLTAGIRVANKAVWDASKSDPALRGMGTTVAAVMIEDSWMGIAHVGDSRVYLIRAGVLTQLTEDHSLVAERVRAGLITKEDAEASSMRNVITRALGQEGVDIDTSEIALMDGDRVVLCTDGLTTMVQDGSILSTVLSSDSPAEGCRALVDLANKGGGRDNITVVLIYMKGNSPLEIIQRLFRMKRR